MTELFSAVLKASFQGSIVILAVIVLRLLLKRAPKSVFCLLWLLAGLRLVLPFEIQSSLSLQPEYSFSTEAVSLREEILDRNGPMLVGQEQTELPVQVPTLPEGEWGNLQSESFLYKVEDGTITGPLTWKDLGANLWLLGVGVMLCASIFSYFRLKRRVREAYVTENGCFQCPGLDTAFVLGFLPPKIYLPMGLSDQEKRFIYDHENTHIARHDHWFKLLGYLVLSIHWFNPLVWLGYGLLCRDIELACDEHVVRNMDLAQRKAYSAALLSCGGHTARIAACPVAFGESNPKKRILNVLNYKRPTFWISLLAVIAVIFVSVCLLTSPEERDPLAQVIQALEGYQNKGSWHIQAEYTYENRPAATRCEMDFWEEEDRWYRISTMDLADGNQQTRGYLSEQGTQYTFFVSGVYHPEYRRWSLAEENERWYPYWLPRFELEEENILEIREEKTEEGSIITTVFSPTTAGEHYTQLYIRWHLDEKGKLIHVERYEQFTTEENGETFLMGIQMEISLVEEDPETVRNVIQNALAEIPEDERVESAGSENEIIEYCREAMLNLQNSEELYLYVSSPYDTNATINVYMKAPNGWLFQYKQALWDYVPVRWLCVGDEQYIYTGDLDESSITTAPYYWKTESGRRFQQPYSLDLDWENLELIYQKSSEKDGLVSHTLRSPETGDVFSFCFDSLGELLWYDVGGTSRHYTQFPYGTSVAEYLAQLAREAKAQADKKPETPGRAVYEELFTRETDGADTTQWIDDLFITYYLDPGEFVRRLGSGAWSVRAEEIVTCMGSMMDLYGPANFAETLEKIKEEDGIRKNILDMMRSLAAGEPVLTEKPAASVLEKCRTALEEYQSQGVWAIQEENSFWGQGALNSSSVSQWFGYGEDYLKWAAIPEDTHDSVWWDLRVNDEAYHRQGWIEKNGEESASPWEQGSTDNQTIQPHWPLWYNWVDADIRLLEQGTDDSTDYVTVTIQGSPFPEEPDPIREYRVTFFFQQDVLQSVELTYERTDSLGGATRRYDLYAFAPSDAVNKISQHYDEAVSQNRKNG